MRRQIMPAVWPQTAELAEERTKDLNGVLTLTYFDRLGLPRLP